MEGDLFNSNKVFVLGDKDILLQLTEAKQMYRMINVSVHSHYGTRSLRCCWLSSTNYPSNICTCACSYGTAYSTQSCLQRGSARSSEPPPGQPSHNPYYDGGVSGLGTSSGVGGYNQQSAVRPSPFARGPFVDQNNGFAGAAPSLVVPPGGGGYGAAGGPGHGNSTYAPSGAWSGEAASSEVALVPIDAAGSRGGDAMEEDDDLPTRSLVDTDTNDVAGPGGSHLRQRRGADSRVAGVDEGRYGSRADPDASRDTWVMVWGVPEGKSNDVLSCFLQFGQVEEQRGVQGSNWMYLK